MVDTHMGFAEEFSAEPVGGLPCVSAHCMLRICKAHLGFDRAVYSLFALLL